MHALRWRQLSCTAAKYIWLACGRNVRCSTRLCIWFSKRAAINRLQSRSACPSAIFRLAMRNLHCNSHWCSAVKTKAPWFSSHSNEYTREVVCAGSCPSFVDPGVHLPALAHPRHRLPRESFKIFQTFSNSSFLYGCALKVEDLWELLPVAQTWRDVTFSKESDVQSFNIEGKKRS